MTRSRRWDFSGTVIRLAVAWVACALTLTLPLSPWVSLAPTDLDSAGVVAPATDAPTSDFPEGDDSFSSAFSMQLFEDDLIHEDHVIQASPIVRKRDAQRAAEPDAPHLEQPERPPAARS